jgi:alkylation response protein AidB-like acyl-CoA dehydrogenase
MNLASMSRSSEALPAVDRRRPIRVSESLFSASEEQDDLRLVMTSLLASKSSPEDLRRHALLPRGYDEELWGTLSRDIGVAGMAVPEQYGGLGLTFTDLAVVLEEAGRYLLCSPLLPTVVLATSALIASGDDAACMRYLPGIVDGSTTATLAGTSGRSGHPVTAAETSTGWVLDGEADFVLDGADADQVLVLAQTTLGPTLFAVEAGDASVLRTPREVLDPTRRQAHLAFRATPATSIGTPGDGGRTTAYTYDVARAALAAEQVGASAHALQACVEFVQQRRQFGRPIGSFQALKHRLADLLVELEGARSAAAYAAACVTSADPDLPMAAAAAQVVCSQTLDLAAREYVQMHGGIGFTWEHPAHLYVRRAIADGVLFGTVADHRSRVAEMLGLDSPPEAIRDETKVGVTDGY